MGSSLATVVLVCLLSVRLLGHPLVVSLDWHLDVSKGVCACKRRQAFEGSLVGVCVCVCERERAKCVSKSESGFVVVGECVCVCVRERERKIRF